MNVAGWVHLGFAAAGGDAKVVAVDSQPGHVDVTLEQDVDVAGVVPTTDPASPVTLTGVSASGPVLTVDYQNATPPTTPSGSATYDPPPPLPVDGGAVPI